MTTKKTTSTNALIVENPYALPLVPEPDVDGQEGEREQDADAGDDDDGEEDGVGDAALLNPPDGPVPRGAVTGEHQLVALLQLEGVGHAAVLADTVRLKRAVMV